MQSDPRDTHDPHGWPHFTALSFDGEVVDSDDSLDALLARLAAGIDLRQGREELAVWQDGGAVAAVVRGDGSVTRFEPLATPQAAQEGRSTNGRPKPPSVSHGTQYGARERRSRHATEQEGPIAGCSGSEMKVASRASSLARLAWEYTHDYD